MLKITELHIYNVYLPLKVSEYQILPAMSKYIIGTFAKFLRLEERQRAEKRTRDAKGHQFTPRWFDLTDEVSATPWGDLEIYCYNGRYTEHRATVDSSGSNGEVDIASIEFNPWQYGNLSTE
ncbi:hypothetical protein V6N12_034354 [Hibiscus sabdariffa]|uniref:Uncharacterized protein n=1 Tax=Hibiscus sabdariffa TaxID=183260 RepID=A0ABR2ALX5_9ROSI